MMSEDVTVACGSPTVLAFSAADSRWSGSPGVIRARGEVVAQLGG
jgi:hypothetical protein